MMMICLLQKVTVHPNSSTRTKQIDISSNLKDIVPANRSSLTSDKLLQSSFFKSSSYAAHTGKKPSISGKESVQDLDAENDVVEISSSKKRKLLITGPSQCTQGETFDLQLKRLIKNEPLQFSENVSSRNLHEKELLVCDVIDERKRTGGSNIQKQKNDILQTVPCGNEETKGSAFLNQVIVCRSVNLF